jgi:hypothetical protein
MNSHTLLLWTSHVTGVSPLYCIIVLPALIMYPSFMIMHIYGKNHHNPNEIICFY